MSEGTPTVLVVDDERDLADLYAAWLEMEYEVVTAYGGEEAIDTMDRSVDVALVDRLMPQSYSSSRMCSTTSLPWTSGMSRSTSATSTDPSIVSIASSPP